MGLGLTHPGLKRSRNEDALLIQNLHDDAMLLAVADGLGGRAAGDVAAATAIESLKHFLPEQGGNVSGLRGSFHEANNAFAAKGRSHRARKVPEDSRGEDDSIGEE